MSATANPLGATANPPRSDDKYAQKSVQLVRGSSFRSDFLQNPYINTTTTMFTINHYSTNTWTFLIHLSFIHYLLNIIHRPHLSTIVVQRRKKSGWGLLRKTDFKFSPLYFANRLYFEKACIHFFSEGPWDIFFQVLDFSSSNIRRIFMYRIFCLYVFCFSPNYACRYVWDFVA